MHFKTPLQPCLSTIAPWRINQSDDNWICLLTMRSINLVIDAPLRLLSEDLSIKVYPTLLMCMMILFLNILTLLAPTQSTDLSHSFTVLCENEITV